MARANIQPGTGPLGHLQQQNLPSEEFPVLGYETGPAGARGRRGGPYHDPSRTRFAAAVKKPAPLHPPNASNGDPTVAARIGGPSADLLQHPQGRSAVVAPRPSPRIKLRAPLLLPTLPTGESLSNLYMTYRQRALQLGAARNACLSRAADAWRRGDGAAAKRFSREGHEMNAKMAAEMVIAAGKLVAERAKVAEQAVRNRDAAWSDDPGDRSARGNPCGGGYGVCLGIASKDIGDGKLSSEERMEAMLDLHGLHSNEATEVLEQFLLAVSLILFLPSFPWSSVCVCLCISSLRANISMAWVRPSEFSPSHVLFPLSFCHRWRRETHRNSGRRSRGLPCPFGHGRPRVVASLGIPMEREGRHHLH